MSKLHIKKDDFIAICNGDFEGTITFEKGGKFVKTTHNKEYKVIIKEI